ncbi:MAG: outer membrane protein assembly factor BamE [Humidesulfovibrio sp.]|uniref:outer membrane protein assembly factor BamE domain-containing protein n=1 Tax=Humidesulfovibrio sp. TaxID=2910988 RepID=UPI0027FA81C5|nr:outer membrane protein assembly factor BamE [Humidesulfovibrio sp.]MDQ7835503.1 outer membrane protein assembly factor BamE [Humidesulfovibrio sp.]
MKSASVLVSLVLAAMLLVGCATSAKKIADVRIGMTKAEVIQTLGEPSGYGAEGPDTYLNYSMLEAVGDWDHTKYSVVLRNGQVVKYGRFDQLK